MVTIKYKIIRKPTTENRSITGCLWAKYKFVYLFGVLLFKKRVTPFCETYFHLCVYEAKKKAV